MKMRFVLLIFVIAFGAIAPMWGQSEDHWDRYQCRTLQSIIDLHRDDVQALNSKKKAILLTGDSFPSQVKLVYLGESRPLPAKKGVLLDFWRKMLKEQAPPAEVFATEVLFKEGADEHRIAVQQPLLDALPKELKKGQAVNAYLIWMGAIKVGNRWEWLFAMNRFDGP